ncbi:MAG TPA: histidine phosphatase family protein, partial [Chthoniobacterales bacterium]|nr:histidine phosphatase family protein [Chthoniobacterales bacterium]
LAEPPVVFLVRHAERADASRQLEKDPDLSEKGRGRAEALARELRDAEITAIYTSEYKRTQETAAPLARSLGITPAIVPAKESAALIRKLKSESGNALIVAHSNTLPEIAEALGISASLKIGETDYDDLFVIVTGARPRLIHLHYR